MIHAWRFIDEPIDEPSASAYIYICLLQVHIPVDEPNLDGIFY